MSSVDNRLVKMQMENGQFTSAANSTMSTLKKLSDSLRLTEGSKGLENVASKAKSVDMSSLASGVEEVKNRFSIMDVVGVTALMNITNSAINAGKNLVKSLTLDPIMDGFREYETKMNALQTIMTNTASKGTSMDEIKDALAELNTYSDKTIYNFGQMTDNIGKFTAAGVSLEDSVASIKGMSNVAAGFGVDATKMAGATYQMSQMLASGKMTLMDWNSMVQAGMGGESLQTAFIETAASMGIFKDESVSFRDSLQEGWLTSEVFVETMKKMADDPSLLAAAQNVTSFTKLIDTMKETVGSGWAMSWEHLFGDKDQSTALFTGISNGFSEMAGSMAEYRNTALQFWNEQGGREALLNGLKNAISAIGSVLGPVYESFKKIIDPWNGQSLVNISKGFESLTEKLKLSDTATGNLSRTFDGIFSLFSIAGSIIGGVVSVIAELIPLSIPIVEGILSITAPLGDMIVQLSNFIKTSGVFKGAMQVISGVISTVANIIGAALSAVGGFVGKIGNIDLSGLTSFKDKIVDSFTPLESMGNVVSKVLDSIKSSFEKFIGVAINFASSVWKALTSVSQAIMDTLGGKGTAITNIMNAGLIGAIVLGIKKVISMFKNLTESVGGIVDSVTEIFDGVKSSLESFQNTLKANTLLKIASALGILAVSLMLIASIDSGTLISSLTAMGVMFGQLVAAMAILDKIGGGAKVGISMIILSSSVLILSNALKKISDIPWADSLKGLLSLASMMGMIIVASKAMEKQSKGMIKSSAAMVIFANAIKILSKAVKLIGELDIATIAKGLLGVGIMMTELALFMKATNLSGMSITKAAGILILSQALVVLSSAVSRMGSIDANALIKGLGGIAIILTEIAIFMKLIGNPSGIISTSIGITILGGALMIMSNAISKMGSLSLETIGKGLLTMASSLLVIAGAMKIMPKNITMQAIAITVLSGALLIIGKAISNMGGMSWESIAKGLITLAGSLTILAIAMKLMAGGIAGSVAITIMAAALALLVPTLVILGSLSLKTISTSLIALAGAFGVIGVAGLLLGPLTPVLIALSAAITLMGIACMAVGIAIGVFSAGLSMLAISGTAGAAALVVVVTSLIGLIPMIATAIAQGLLNIMTVFINGATIITTALAALLSAVLNAIILSVPKITEAITVVLTAILTALQNIIPQLVTTVMLIITTIMETLTTNLPLIAGMVVEFILTLITTILQELANGIPKVAGAITNVIVAIINTIGTNVPVVVNAIFDMIIAMINGLANAVDNKMPQVRAAIKKLTTAVINELKACISDAVNVGGDIIKGMANGISNGIQWVKDAASNVARSALNAAKNLLGIKSPSKEFFAIGRWTDEGMANGMAKYSGLVSDEAVGVADGALTGIQKAMSSVGELFNSDLNNQPVIRPVLDLSEIQNGNSQIGSMMNGDYAIKTSVNAARQVSSGFMSKQDYTSPTTSPTTNSNNNNNSPIYNSFNITGDNPREIANEVSKIIQTQVERRDSVWA